MKSVRMIAHWCYLFAFLGAGLYFAWAWGSWFAVYGDTGMYESEAAGRAFVSAILAILCFIQVAVLITAHHRHWRKIL